MVEVGGSSPLAPTNKNKDLGHLRVAFFVPEGPWGKHGANT